MVDNILVTGGAGYIGSHTVVELINAGMNPIIIDNFCNSSPDVITKLERLSGREITSYNVDYRDRAEMQIVLARHAVVGAIHFAAFKYVGESMTDPLKYFDNNVSGFIGLLLTLLDNEIFNVVFSSSSAVYGTSPTNRVTEETPCAPESPYGWSKYMGELVLKSACEAHSKFNGVSLRYFNVVGAHSSGIIGESIDRHPQNLMPIIIKAAKGIIPAITIFGSDYPTQDGTGLRDYVHVVDLAKAHVVTLENILNNSSTGYSTYNIGTGIPTSVLEMIRTFESENEVHIPYVFGNRRAGDPPACYASADKVRKELGWRSQKSIKDAVRDSWRWSSNHTADQEDAENTF